MLLKYFYDKALTGGFGAWTDAELPVDQSEATDVCDWHTKQCTM